MPPCVALPPTELPAPPGDVVLPPKAGFAALPPRLLVPPVAPLVAEVVSAPHAKAETTPSNAIKGALLGMQGLAMNA